MSGFNLGKIGNSLSPKYDALRLSTTPSRSPPAIGKNGAKGPRPKATAAPNAVCCPTIGVEFLFERTMFMYPPLPFGANGFINPFV